MMATTSPESAVDWNDEDQRIMELLLLDPAAVAPAHASGDDEDQIMLDAFSGRAVTPSAKAAKGKLSARERKERHREVVRRSYHRNKQTLMDLRSTVKKLETQFKSLTMSSSSSPSSKEEKVVNPGKEVLNERVEELKQQCATLNAKSEELRKEGVRMQSVLLRHQEFTRVVHESFEPDDFDESTSEDEDMAAWISSDPSSPATSEEDFSPFKNRPAPKRPLRASMRPTHAIDLSPPAPIARDARKEVGFSPLSLVTAKQLVSRTCEGIVNFTLSGSSVSTGAQVMGWEDKRLIDGTTVKFSLRKRFQGLSSYDLMSRTWQCFSDPDCTAEKFRGLMELRILQRVNDDTIIALRDTQSDDNTTVFRCVYLLFRVRTNNGFLICSRSLDDIKLTEKEKRKISRSGKQIRWVDMFGWFVFDRDGYLEPSSYFQETGSQVEYGGFNNYMESSHVSTLVMNTLMMALRWEGLIVGPVFSLPPST
ncbi:hypothetical protein Poli38472_014194 [Pythium oligandrum]|uniref:BZIP domain-containing protein n=1 Tax=Pythium oligandrum TaxID=41045 RepID=A0A8K1CKS7_PYTOL|nr:hypothetical protein Poli38472_014194 [Pythium oligandrum]|eukprot:TMW64077.1 hypothetical protein Poli38472_014194 [Pythium oligandrum]